MKLPYAVDAQHKQEELQANFDALSTLSPASSLSDADVAALRRLSGLIKSGTGTPEGNLDAPVGTLYLQTDGVAGTTLWAKETGTGNTGWAAK